MAIASTAIAQRLTVDSPLRKLRFTCIRQVEPASSIAHCIKPICISFVRTSAAATLVLTKLLFLGRIAALTRRGLLPQTSRRSVLCSVCASCLPVYLLVTPVSSAKTDEPIAILFGIWSRVDPRNCVLDRNPDATGGSTFQGCPVYYKHPKPGAYLGWVTRVTI